MGLTRPGQALEGPPDDVAFAGTDTPAPADDEAGRDLSPEVVAALIAHLPALEVTNVEVRVVVEQLIDTGRRPIVQLFTTGAWLPPAATPD